jgi:hypothetical protein
MASHVHSITFDCRDPYALAQFWSRVGDLREDPAHPNAPTDDEALLVGHEGPRLLFVEVPEGKTVKNRVHLDLSAADDTTRDAEVDRLLGLGAALHEDHRRPDGGGWVTLLDPEGNEFCVELSQAERAARA